MRNRNKSEKHSKRKVFSKTIRLRNGRVLRASDYGLTAFVFYVAGSVQLYCNRCDSHIAGSMQLIWQAMCS